MKKILLIVEGADDEKRFIDAYFEKVGIDVDYRVFRYGCNLFDLYAKLLKVEPESDFENIDLPGVLRDTDNLPLKEDVKVLYEDFTDIFLIFDLEYHDTNHTAQERYNILSKMAKYFNNSTELGLLLLDSPMVEAYRDIGFEHGSNKNVRINPDITVETSATYKKEVGNRGINLELGRYGKDTFILITALNYRRASEIYLGDLKSVLDFNPAYYFQGLHKYIAEKRRIPVNACISFVPAILSDGVAKQMKEIPLNSGLHFPSARTIGD